MNYTIRKILKEIYESKIQRKIGIDKLLKIFPYSIPLLEKVIKDMMEHRLSIREASELLS